MLFLLSTLLPLYNVIRNIFSKNDYYFFEF
jgi:hypothetical protein